MNRRFLVAAAVFVAAVVGLLLYQETRPQFDLPKGQPDRSETVTVPDGIGASTKTIMLTDGVKHSVPLVEIIGGGPAKDGIPSIDQPKFTSIAEAAGWLGDEDPGIAVSLNGINRFYPFRILVWHEIVNDVIAGERVLVTYCPLCYSGIVFDPLVKGERVEFGTSGKLWNSNLVMYDRKTDSLWSQVLGEAIVGELTGTKLGLLPTDLMRFGGFRTAYQNGQVLSRDTGASRDYGYDPYGDYYTTPGTYFPLTRRDNRLEEKTLVFGLVVNGEAKAYAVEAVRRSGEVTDTFQGKTIVGQYDQRLDVVRLYEKKPDGTLQLLTPFVAYWFSWSSAHPDTDLLK